MKMRVARVHLDPGFGQQRINWVITFWPWHVECAPNFFTFIIYFSIARAPGPHGPKLPNTHTNDKGM